MPELYLPKKIYFGEDSAEKFTQNAFENILILSDAEDVNKKSLISKIKCDFDKNVACSSVIIEPDTDMILDKSMQYISKNIPDQIIAVGSAKLCDIAAFISYQSGIEYSIVPFFSPCSMNDFEKADYKTYCHSPTEVVLDPMFLSYVNSGTVGYDSMSCFAYAVDALIGGCNSVIEVIAVSSASTILNNVIGAYRGNYKTIQKVLYALYYAVLAHRNSCNNSVLNEVCSFFNQLGISKQTAAAICIPEIAEYYRDNIPVELARYTGLLRSGEDSTFSINRLIERIRKVQAALNIPRSVNAILNGNELYLAFRENTHLPADLLDLCFYGSFKFMKL